MKLETVGGYHIIDAVDRALMSLVGANRTPGVYKAGACLTAYEADTGNREYKRIFRDEDKGLWVCECANES